MTIIKFAMVGVVYDVCNNTMLIILLHCLMPFAIVSDRDMRWQFSIRHVKLINSAGCGFKFTKLIFCKHDLHVYMH